MITPIKILFATLALLVIQQTCQALNPFNALCWGTPWKVTECQVTTVYEDGETAKTGFIPDKEQNVTVSACYKFGCHPLYCDDWRANLRTSCKNEWNRQRALLTKFTRGLQKKIVSESFEGCAVMPAATGVLYPLDWLTRKAFAESWFAVCTTDTQAQENAFMAWAKEHGSELLNWFKQTASSGWSKAQELATTSNMPFGSYTRQLATKEKAQASANNHIS